MKKNVIIYCRVSTDKQSKTGESLEVSAIAISLKYGSFLNSTLIGLAMCMSFFNAIRPWNG